MGPEPQLASGGASGDNPHGKQRSQNGRAQHFVPLLSALLLAVLGWVAFAFVLLGGNQGYHMAPAEEVRRLVREASLLFVSEDIPARVDSISAIANSTSHSGILWASINLLFSANALTEIDSALTSAVQRGVIPEAGFSVAPRPINGYTLFPVGSEEEALTSLRFDPSNPLFFLGLASAMSASNPDYSRELVQTAALLTNSQDPHELAKIAIALQNAQAVELSADAFSPKRLPSDLAIAALINLEAGYRDRASFCLRQLRDLVSPSTFQSIIRLPSFLPYFDGEVIQLYADDGPPVPR